MPTLRQSDLQVGDRIILTWPTADKFLNIDIPGTITQVINSAVLFIADEANSQVPWLHDAGGKGPRERCWWVEPFQPFTRITGGEESKESDLPKGYRMSSDGFLTNDENWKPGKWLL